MNKFMRCKVVWAGWQCPFQFNGKCKDAFGRTAIKGVSALVLEFRRIHTRVGSVSPMAQQVEQAIASTPSPETKTGLLRSTQKSRVSNRIR